MLRAEVWRSDGVTHRENGPAVTYFDKQGNEYYHCWYRNGQLFRSHDQPAVIESEPDIHNRNILEEWYVNGLLGRRGEEASRIIRSSTRDIVLI